MKADVQKKEESEIAIDFVVEAAEVEKLIDEAAKQLSKDLKIDGFRPGHVPTNVVEQKVGRPVLWEEAARLGVPRFYAEVVKEHDLEPIGQPEVSMKKVAPDNDFEFSIAVAVLPNFEVADYKGVEAEKREAKVEEAQVEETIDQLLMMRSSQKLVDRAAAEGDRVEVDLVVKMDGKVIENGESTDMPLVIGENKFIPGFEGEVTGMKKGDTKEFTLPFPDEYHEKKLAGEDAQFAVTMKNVYEMEKPELDEEFVKTLGGDVKSPDDLKKQIRKNLEQEAEAKEKERFEMSVFDKIADKTEMELPEVLVRGEKDKMFGELRQQVEQQGMEMDKYLESLRKTKEELQEGWKEQAEKRVKSGLILRKIGITEKITAPEAEVEQEIEQAKMMYAQGPEKEVYESDEFRAYVEDQLRNRKVFEFIAENAKAVPAKEKAEKKDSEKK
ncbi:MAG: trigger factor, partial [Myxococcales bacterium]|nr:trigger factor [Myxococcales bacterium]